MMNILEIREVKPPDHHSHSTIYLEVVLAEALPFDEQSERDPGDEQILIAAAKMAAVWQGVLFGLSEDALQMPARELIAESGLFRLSRHGWWIDQLRPVYFGAAHITKIIPADSLIGIEMLELLVKIKNAAIADLIQYYVGPARPNILSLTLTMLDGRRLIGKQVIRLLQPLLE